MFSQIKRLIKHFFRSPKVTRKYNRDPRYIQKKEYYGLSETEFHLNVFDFF